MCVGERECGRESVGECVGEGESVCGRGRERECVGEGERVCVG